MISSGWRPIAGAIGTKATPSLRRLAIAIAGASGYVGRLLANRLAGAGHQVLALARHPGALPTGERIEAVAVDVADPEATARALVGCRRRLLPGARHGRWDRVRSPRPRARSRLRPWRPSRPVSGASSTWAAWAGATCRPTWSAARQVGAVLAASGVPVVELRAAVILGAGSISYEMLRSLTERFPIMVCPRWITTRLQPLAECDLLDYLAGSLVAPPGIYEIGTPDVTDYGGMMRCYAEARGLRPRRIFTVPFVTPSLSARWVDLVSPVDRRISHALIESLVNEVVVHDPERTYAAFGITPLPVERSHPPRHQRRG